MITNFSVLPIATSYEGTLTFLGETAGFRNTLGMYKIGADGAIYDVEVIFPNSSATGSGGELIPGVTTVDMQFSAGDRIGFFLMSNAANNPTSLALLSDADASYVIRNQSGELASIHDTGYTQIYHVDSAGTETLVQTQYNTLWHSAADASNNYALNADGIDHTIWDMQTVEGRLVLDMRFEDLWNGGDRDFEDVIFRLDVGPANTVLAVDETVPTNSALGELNADIVHVTSRGTSYLDPLANDVGSFTLTSVNGVALEAGMQITLEDGTIIEVDSGSRLRFSGADNTTSTAQIITYTAEDAQGNSYEGVIVVSSSPVDGTGSNDTMVDLYADADGNQVGGSDGAAEVVLGYGGNDKLFTGDGDDAVFGGSGNDNIRAGDGDDVLTGDAGHDFLDGGAGADVMEGGAGNDVYWVSEAGDVVVETGGGTDKVKSDVDYTLGEALEDLWLNIGTAALVANGNANRNMLVGNENDNVVSGFDGNDNLYGKNGDDDLRGGNDSDKLFAGSGNDTLSGDDGRDKLFGAGGSDTLTGGADDDKMFGGAGADTLTGGTGRDILRGGTGADTFVFSSGDGRDALKDFELGVDRLVFTDVDAADINLNIKSWGVFLQYGSGDRLVMRGFTPDEDFSLDDLLQTGSSADLI